MPSKTHHCSLDLGSSSMLPKDYKPALCRSLRKLCLVSEHHPETSLHLRSYPTVVAERQRHIREGGAGIVHPFSIFSLSWKTFMVLVNFLHMVMSTFRLIYVLDPSPATVGPNKFDHIMLGLNILCMIDILVTFNFGYVEEHGSIILYRSAIARHYLRSWFLVDLISCLPAAYLLLLLRERSARYLMVAHLLPVLRLARLPSAMRNMTQFCQIFDRSHLHHSLIYILVLFLLSTHWCGCLFYVCSIFSYYWYGVMPKGYSLFIEMQHFNATEDTMTVRYEFGIFIALASFFGSGFALFVRKEADEALVHGFILIYTTLFMVYIFVLLIKVKLSQYISLIKYYEMMNQVKEYMRHRQFPAELKKRVIAFYYYTFQSTYFREEVIFESLSEQLRNEIILHTSHKLVDKMALFDGLPASVVGSVLGCLRHEVYMPNDLIARAGDIGDCMYFIANGTVAVYSLKGVETYHKLVDKMALFDGLPASVVGSVLGCLRHEVYMPNDLIARAGDIGDCMYFIANGTVAVYSLKGVEVCHLQDGAHFGEVALLMKDSKRMASVVAVEITQVYRLDAEDFRHFIATNQTLYERIEALSSQRMHETVLLDEAFQRERVAAMTNVENSKQI